MYSKTGITGIYFYIKEMIIPYQRIITDLHHVGRQIKKYQFITLNKYLHLLTTCVNQPKFADKETLFLF